MFITDLPILAEMATEKSAALNEMQLSMEAQRIAFQADIHEAEKEKKTLGKGILLLIFSLSVCHLFSWTSQIFLCIERPEISHWHLKIYNIRDNLFVKTTRY